MKLYPFLLTLFFNPLFAQTELFNGRATYTMYLGFNGTEIYKAELLFNDSISLFTYQNKTSIKKGDIDFDKNVENSDQQDHAKIMIYDTNSYRVILKKKNDLLYTQHKDIGTGGYYFSYENIPKLNWVLLPDKKSIQNIDCSLARTSFRGRTYYAWYATAIPNNYGPWKLSGLPGLILETHDETREVVFKIKSIKIPFHTDLPLFNPDYPLLPLKEHIKKWNDVDSQIASKIQSKLQRGITVKVVKSEKKAIELDYGDL